MYISNIKSVQWRYGLNNNHRPIPISSVFKDLISYLAKQSIGYSLERVPLLLGFRRFLGIWRISARNCLIYFVLWSFLVYHRTIFEKDEDPSTTPIPISSVFKDLISYLAKQSIGYSLERVPLLLGFRRFLGIWRISARNCLIYFV